VQLTAAGLADPLFAGLPAQLLVQQAHQDHLATLPPGARLLAWNAQAPVQAFAAGDALRAVQFHPEFDLPQARAITEADQASLDAARPGGCACALAALRPTPVAARILANWRDGWLGAAGPAPGAPGPGR